METWKVSLAVVLKIGLAQKLNLFLFHRFATQKLYLLSAWQSAEFVQALFDEASQVESSSMNCITLCSIVGQYVVGSTVCWRDDFRPAQLHGSTVSYLVLKFLWPVSIMVMTTVLTEH